MADWDEDSPQLRQNLTALLHHIRNEARRRKIPAPKDARSWHRQMMGGLTMPAPAMSGVFRGEPGLERVRVTVGLQEGTSPARVAADLERFADTLQQALGRLDELLPPDAEPDADGLAAILDVSAWVHAEWIRIHPFPNGNGRTARLWANSILMRYGLPPFVHLRPRPDGDYGKAGAAAMSGDWKPTVVVFIRMYVEFMAGAKPGTPKV